MFLSNKQLKNLDQNGYVIVKNAIDPETTVDRVFNEYEFVLDKLCNELFAKGDLIVFNKKLVHGSLDNESDQVRVSCDLRYNPIGEATGRKWFPGFNARSKNDPVKWAESWVEAKNTLVKAGTPDFYSRWDADNPSCA